MSATVRLVGGGGAPDARLREDVASTARRMLALDLVVGSLGNVSARRESGFVVTPTRMSYEEMGAADLVEVAWDGTVVGPARPSREWPMHAAIYAGRPDAGAIVHTHSVHAVAWSFLGEPLEPTLEEMAYYGVGRVETSAPAAAGSEQLASAAVTALGRSAAALLGRHGVVAVAATPQEALVRAAVVERQAHVAWLLRGAGPLDRRRRRRRRRR